MKKYLSVDNERGLLNRLTRLLRIAVAIIVVLSLRLNAAEVAPDPIPPVPPDYKVFAGRVWYAPEPAANAKRVGQHVRVVDYGDDFAHTRADQWLAQGRVTGDVVDLDGDGQTNDIMTGMALNLTEPVGYSAGKWHPRLDQEATDFVFYTGRTYHYLKYTRPSLLEGGGPNQDHSYGSDDLNFMLDSRDNFTTPVRAWGLWLWKKDHFRNGGDRYRVSFGEGDRIGLLCPRHWGTDPGKMFDCVIVGRFVVADGDQFFISEQIFQKGCGANHWIYPAVTKWAKYYPKPSWDIAFDSKKAAYETHSFSDVKWVGYYLAMDEYTVLPEDRGVKMGAFEVYATVDKPVRPSETFNMVAVPATEALVAGKTMRVEPFYLSKCEVPYSIYARVYRCAFSDSFLDKAGMIFDRAADVGSMRDGKGAHQPDEPATSMTWLDAIAWCNGLSEYESKEPVYYADPEFKTVFRVPRERRFLPEYLSNWVAQVYVKWNADGYRLPTVAEWIAAYKAGGNQSVAAGKAHGTQAVGTSAADKIGLCDMAGNVWEYVWDYGDAYDPKSHGFKARHVVMGGDWSGIEPSKVQENPWGDMPFRGNYNIGLRVVRSMGTGAGRAAFFADMNSGADMAGKTLGVPSWVFAEGERLPAASPGLKTMGLAGLKLVAVPEGNLEMMTKKSSVSVFISGFDMAATETTFRQWLPVYHWALAHGYKFSFDGDMGSLYHRPWAYSHMPDEPVTRISWWDALVWCNALSEMEGLKPCYYSDQDRTQIVRESWQIQRRCIQRGDRDKEIRDKMGRFPHYGPGEPYVDWSSDGYRLPTYYEFCHAAYPMPADALDWKGGGVDKYAWHGGNSSGTTHPVGKLEPNKRGIYDLSGNVAEYVFETKLEDSPKQKRNPKVLAPAVWQGSTVQRMVLGGAFCYVRGEKGTPYSFDPRDAEIIKMNDAYPEMGFRVVRCKKGTHPVNGVEP